jgi:hypothetical protein
MHVLSVVHCRPFHAALPVVIASERLTGEASFVLYIGVANSAFQPHRRNWNLNHNLYVRPPPPPWAASLQVSPAAAAYRPGEISCMGVIMVVTMPGLTDLSAF